MDNTIASAQKPVPLLYNEDEMHGNDNNCNTASQNPQLIESTQHQQSFSGHVHQTSPKCLQEAKCIIVQKDARMPT